MSKIASRGTSLGRSAKLLMVSEASFSSPVIKNSSFTFIFSSAFFEMYSFARGLSTLYASFFKLLGTNHIRRAGADSAKSSEVNFVNVLTYQGKFCNNRIFKNYYSDTS